MVRVMVWTASLGALGCNRETEPIRIPSDFHPPPHVPAPQPTAGEASEPEHWSPVEGFVGEVAYESVFAGTVFTPAEACTARIAVRGTPYVGNCPACEFAFDLETDVLDAQGTDCDQMVPYWAFVEDEIYKNPKLGWIGQYQILENVLWFGYSLELSQYGYGYYEGPFWVMVHHDQFRDHSFAFDGEHMEWGAFSHIEYGYGLSEFLDYSCPSLPFLPDGPFPEGVQTEGTVPCDGYSLDVYEFEATEGDEIGVAIDTVSAWTTFQPLLLLNDPDECVKAYNVSAFVCEYMADPTAPCAGLSMEVPETGTYQIIVQPIVGTCVDPETAEYVLQLQGASGPLVQVADDVPHHEEVRSFDARVQLDGHVLLAD
jgi:hypothetical protein